VLSQGAQQLRSDEPTCSRYQDRLVAIND